MDSCKSKEIYLKTTECLSCSSTLSAANSPARVRPADRSDVEVISLNGRPGDRTSECTSTADHRNHPTGHLSDQQSDNQKDHCDLKEKLDDSANPDCEALNDLKVPDSNSKPISSAQTDRAPPVSNPGPDMKKLLTDQYLASPIQQSPSSAYPPPQSYHQMNIQNNSLNFRYSPQQYGSPLDQPNQMTSQMTNYMLSNNVNNLNLNSPTSLNSPPNPYFNANAQFGQAAMHSQSAHQYSQQYGYANQLSSSNRSSNPMGFAGQASHQPARYSPATFSKSTLSPSSLSPSSLSPTSPPPPVTKPSSDANLKTFNFQNRTHIHGYHNNFEPDDQGQFQGQSQFQDYKDDYRDEYRSDRGDYEEDRGRNRFLTTNRSNLPLSNVDCGNNSAAPRTGSASPISSYNSPAVVESNRIKKNKFNFRKKFKIKHSPTKQSKKSNKIQKGKNPGLLYSQLNKGINSGTLNSINKMQLSILNTGLIRIESEKATAIIPKEPFDLSTSKFIDHLMLLRKYNVLFKIEYFVS